ncbi:MAG TPA: sensor domain-containing protein [Jatrophihabitantaceae bacterium]|jgi:hypothetical protein|nr:sensor domain-containing protein [Jatrophihabitantaceae bacterium]
MVTTIDVPPTARTLPPAHRVPLRLHLLGRSVVIMFTSLTGAALFSFWITAAAISPLTIFAIAVLPVTAAVRGYANIHRRAARQLTGWPMQAGYRSPGEGSAIKRAWSIGRDRQSWRDAFWCVLHSIVACFTSSLTLGFFAGGVFYLIYPFLYWVTPQAAFGHPFGGLVILHSVAQATLMMPFALVSFGIWYAIALPLARLELHLTGALLSPRAAQGARL